MLPYAKCYNEGIFGARTDLGIAAAILGVDTGAGAPLVTYRRVEGGGDFCLKSQIRGRKGRPFERTHIPTFIRSVKAVLRLVQCHMCMIHMNVTLLSF